MLFWAVCAVPAAYAKSPRYLEAKRVSEDISQFTKWNAMLRRYSEQSRQSCTERSATCDALNEWRGFLERIDEKDLSTLEKAEAVNSYVNRVSYADDNDVWGKSDYWATPREFLSHQGDCEDYAITKYFSLLALGVREEDMRLVIMNDRRKGVIHAALSVDIDGKTYLLDNQTPDVVVYHTLGRYRPIYAINTKGWWRYYS
ncbi:MAG: conserved periplasmic protein of unknown function [Rickettsiales bacterium]|jgi:predicted transglutaminase-like cysteine proteinase|nr:conserved periplasmic protein of unknown function [Rickettsiales bacterium]